MKKIVRILRVAAATSLVLVAVIALCPLVLWVVLCRTSLHVLSTGLDLTYRIIEPLMDFLEEYS